MKKQINPVVLAIFLTTSLFAMSCGENKNQSVEVNTPQEVKMAEKKAANIADASFTDGMTGKVFHNYLQLRTALVRSDADGAQTAADNLAESFNAERAALKSIAQNIAGTEDLEEQRSFFFEFTREVESLFKNGLSGGTIYKQYCPMAFDNSGASWFSEIPEIRNPYFGDKMLKCGKVEEKIEKK